MVFKYKRFAQLLKTRDDDDDNFHFFFVPPNIKQSVAEISS